MNIAEEEAKIAIAKKKLQEIKLEVLHEEQKKEAGGGEELTIQKFKKRLANEYNLKIDDRFEMAYYIAWKYGHAYGLSGIEIHFSNLVDLIRM